MRILFVCSYCNKQFNAFDAARDCEDKHNPVYKKSEIRVRITATEIGKIIGERFYPGGGAHHLEIELDDGKRRFVHQNQVEHLGESND